MLNYSIPNYQSYSRRYKTGQTQNARLPSLTNQGRIGGIDVRPRPDRLLPRVERGGFRQQRVPAQKGGSYSGLPMSRPGNAGTNYDSPFYRGFDSPYSRDELHEQYDDKGRVIRRTRKTAPFFGEQGSTFRPIPPGAHPPLNEQGNVLSDLSGNRFNSAYQQNQFTPPPPSAGAAPPPPEGAPPDRGTWESSMTPFNAWNTPATTIDELLAQQKQWEQYYELRQRELDFALRNKEITQDEYNQYLNDLNAEENQWDEYYRTTDAQLGGGAGTDGAPPPKAVWDAGVQPPNYTESPAYDFGGLQEQKVAWQNYRNQYFASLNQALADGQIDRATKQYYTDQFRQANEQFQNYFKPLNDYYTAVQKFQNQLQAGTMDPLQLFGLYQDAAQKFQDNYGQPGFDLQAQGMLGDLRKQLEDYYKNYQEPNASNQPPGTTTWKSTITPFDFEGMTPATTMDDLLAQRTQWNQYYGSRKQELDWALSQGSITQDEYNQYLSDLDYEQKQWDDYYNDLYGQLGADNPPPPTPPEPPAPPTPPGEGEDLLGQQLLEYAKNYLSGKDLFPTEEQLRNRYSGQLKDIDIKGERDARAIAQWMNEQGFLRSGETGRRLMENAINYQDQARRFITDVASQAEQQGRYEKGQRFSQVSDYAQQLFDRNLQQQQMDLSRLLAGGQISDMEFQQAMQEAEFNRATQQMDFENLLAYLTGERDFFKWETEFGAGGIGAENSILAKYKNLLDPDNPFTNPYGIMMGLSGLAGQSQGNMSDLAQWLTENIDWDKFGDWINSWGNDNGGDTA